MLVPLWFLEAIDVRNAFCCSKPQYCSEMGVDTSLFGQCLTRFGILADAECAKIDEEVINLVCLTLSKVWFSPSSRVAVLWIFVCLKKKLSCSLHNATLFVLKEFDAVSDVPKQYRWTKKPSPSTHSAYITTAHSKLEDFTNELTKRNHPNPETLTNFVITSSYGHLVNKAGEVRVSEFINAFSILIEFLRCWWIARCIRKC